MEYVPMMHTMSYFTEAERTQYINTEKILFMKARGKLTEAVLSFWRVKREVFLQRAEERSPAQQRRIKCLALQ